MSSVLNIRDLSVMRASKPLTQPITLSLSLGDVLRITGDNGRGKTTLLEAIVGIHKEWKGAIEIRAAGISFKRQGAPAFESLNLEEVAPLLVGYQPPRYQDILYSLKLAELSQTPIGLLSGGEAQRVMLALCLLKQHHLLLLDEPFVGVDPESAELIAHALAFESRERGTIVVEHKPSTRLQFTNEVVLEPPLN